MSRDLHDIIASALQLPPAEMRALRERLDDELARTSPPMSEDEFERMLAAQGIISLPDADLADDAHFEPIEIKGKPLSEAIIEERR